MPLHLADVTLVCVDCQYPALALRALRLSMQQVNYAEVLFFTDADQAQFSPQSGIRWLSISSIRSSIEYSRFVLGELASHIHTSHVQVVQWDGYVINSAAWSSDFLEYDYIGARWWFEKPGQDVGNGGFSIRSRKLLRAVEHLKPVVDKAEDVLICKDSRTVLESQYGIRFAPAVVADRYSFEGKMPSAQVFGFHRFFNFALFYDEATLKNLISQLSEQDFFSQATLTMIGILVRRGRHQEAVYYLQKFRKKELPPGIVERLEKLKARLQLCPCGSGSLFLGCCGQQQIGS